MREPTFDIFRGAIGSGEEVWLEAVCGRENAKQRMEQIAARSPGRYFLFDVHHHFVVDCADTTKLALPSSATRASSPRNAKIA